jgi:hypothetical protein
VQAGIFFEDRERLKQDDVPMKGTLLGLNGIPWSAYGTEDETTDIISQLPNQLVKLGAKFDQTQKLRSIADVRQCIEKITQNRQEMRKIRSNWSSSMAKDERIAIRKMMSRYWHNSSNFAIDLVGAVVRQGSFIEKMHQIDWLHSPALPSTMLRLLEKYSWFVVILARYQENMAVPTLDVDLAWHTHQCHPAAYMQYTVAQCNQFIDHDDKIAETKLNDAFAWTSKVYKKLTGEPYSECTCWYCEAVRESTTSLTSRLFHTSSVKRDQVLHRVEQDPAKSIHISTHNAVRPEGDAVYDRAARKHADELERHYQRACERARRKGKPVPKRDDYYYSNAWGYPVYMPAYSPYVGPLPYAPMYYPVTPGCMAVGVGAAGNCCSGTCGAGVAAGACAGSGSGGCGGGGSSGVSVFLSGV